ncbi:MAG TPA: entericidin A/B family lipoprotein [Amaricoccus sp.]|nr:entericidin A/B family lipoprotein [Amaricoccus sp.]MCB1372199.1 entericidin A/B family lipoprotein [Paracoccaceae bacterium]MCB1373752.1 entericidin A/B family lipoprotein [Paracoccaceae bacterium]MCB1403082.1 entericidin A/B family lipoprotein [Paracoccaceae bacterium]HPG23575.1 entericidin A/B family lipoprotein [Amaricoccus sp.]HRW16284.1 entericidin A/B family lipoprotein [Amaricoccus sp.]
MNRKILCALLAVMALSACNTLAGAGKDVSATGDALTGTAEKVDSKM